MNRKFADIEAANHRLASALYFKDEQNILTSFQSQKPAAAGSSESQQSQDAEKDNVLKETDDSIRSPDVSEDTHQTESGDKNGTHPWETPPMSQSETRTSGMVNAVDDRQTGESGTHSQVELTSVSSPLGTDLHPGPGVFYSERYDSENLLTSVDGLSEDNVEASLEKSLSSSPELSPLSLDSCDFSAHMFTDISSCAQTHQSIGDLAESPWADIIDLFGIGKDSSGCLDDGDDQSAPAGGGDNEQEVEPENQSECFPQATCSNMCQTEELRHSTGDCTYEYLHSYHDDQGQTTTVAAEPGFTDIRTSEAVHIDSLQILTPSRWHYDSTDLQSKAFSDCMQENSTPFEGVAQSFSVSLHYPQHRTIPTPPREHEWMFPDILKDGESPHAEEPGCEYPGL